jgi:hypothetical protein
MTLSVLKTHGQIDEQPRMTQGGKFKCPACDMEFDTQEQLDEHMRTKHNM